MKRHCEARLAEAPKKFCLDQHLVDFRNQSCFKNAVGSISVDDLFIDLIAYTKKMGGQFTSTLAGNRTGCLINGYRHSFTIYSTGKIILTNLFFLNDLNSVYSFFLSLFVTLLKEGIAHFVSEPRACRLQARANRKLRMMFLIENCQFSFQILPILFKQKYIYETNGIYSANANSESLAALKDYLFSNLNPYYDFENTTQPIQEQVLRKNFPADLLRFTIVRRMCVQEFFQVKSRASRKRNKDRFSGQRISIHIFPNGKIIVTGMQTKEDLNPIFSTMQLLVNYFL